MNIEDIYEFIARSEPILLGDLTPNADLHDDPGNENVDQRHPDDLALFQLIPKTCGIRFTHGNFRVVTIHRN